MRGALLRRRVWLMRWNSLSRRLTIVAADERALVSGFERSPSARMIECRCATLVESLAAELGVRPTIAAS